MYLKVLEEVGRQKRLAGREWDEIRVVAVTKQRSLSDLENLYQLGCRDFGENRIPEALQKIECMPHDIRWHFIGPLQKNKVNKAVGRFSLIHSVDNFTLAEKIAKQSQEKGIVTAILLQVNISKEASKQGLTKEEWLAHMPTVLSLKGLDVQGLMTMAPLTDDEAVIRKTFRGLRQFRDELKLKHLSMGMSRDFSIAIEEGATILRIGTSIFV